MVALITLFMSNIVSAEALVNQFDCKVKSLNITVVKDGVVNNYTSTTNAYNVGDTLMIKVSDKDNLIALTVSYKDELFLTKNFTYDKYSQYGNDNIRLDDSRYQNFFFYYSDDWFNATTDYSKLTLNRYYKSDWSGYYTVSDSYKVETIALDCRTLKDGLPTLRQMLIK